MGEKNLSALFTTFYLKQTVLFYVNYLSVALLTPVCLSYKNWQLFLFCFKLYICPLKPSCAPPAHPHYSPPSITLPTEKNGDEVGEGTKAYQPHAPGAFNVVLCFLFCFWGTGDISGTQFFGFNCKQLPTPISREHTLSPTGSTAYLFLWNHSNRVAFKRWHFIFSLLLSGRLHERTFITKWKQKSSCCPLLLAFRTVHEIEYSGFNISINSVWDVVMLLIPVKLIFWSSFHSDLQLQRQTDDITVEAKPRQVMWCRMTVLL